MKLFAKLEGLMMFVIAALLFFGVGLINAVKVKAQDPAPAKQSVTLKLSNIESTVTLKAVNDRIKGAYQIAVAYQIKQVNKKFAYPDKNSADVIRSLDFVQRQSEILNFKPKNKKVSQTENRRSVTNTNYSAHTIIKRDICYLRT